MVVVPVQPAREQPGLLAVALVGADVRPLVEEGSVVALDLPVGLRAAWANEALLDAEPVGGLPEHAGVAVRLGVIGEQPLDRDAVAGEELRAALQEQCTGLGTLVREDL